MYLFLDSTKDLTIGLLDSTFKFLQYEFVTSKKTSLILQQKIYELLKNENIELTSLAGVIYAAGPGSYTGMRVAQGFVDICRWQKLSVFSFCHHQVPQLLGKHTAIYLDHAFKNEIFVAKLTDAEITTELVREEDFSPRAYKETQIYSNSGEEFEGVISTRELIRQECEKIMEKVVTQNQLHPLYYYRPLDQEFKVANG